MTGSTGSLGGRVDRRLAAAGSAQLLLARNPARAPALPLVTIAQDDIADVAAAVLRSPAGHAGQTYDLTGPQAIDEAYRSRAVYDAPGWQVDAWVSTYTAIANGELDGVSDAIERIAGHPATSPAELLSR